MYIIDEDSDNYRDVSVSIVSLFFLFFYSVDSVQVINSFALFVKSTPILEVRFLGGVFAKERMIQTTLILMNSFHLMVWMSGLITCWSFGRLPILVFQVRRIKLKTD